MNNTFASIEGVLRGGGGVSNSGFTTNKMAILQRAFLSNIYVPGNQQQRGMFLSNNYLALHIQ